MLLFFPGVRDCRSIYRYVIHFIFTEVGSGLIYQSTELLIFTQLLISARFNKTEKEEKRRDASQNFSMSANLVEINTAA